MTTIRGLIVDDVIKNILFIVGRLDRAFREFDWTVEWERATDAGEAHELLNTTGPYDLIVIDLLYERTDIPDGNEASGLDLVTTARKRSPHAFIAAISTGDRNRPDLFEDAKNHGSDDVIRREEFSTDSQKHSPTAIAKAARTHLLNNGAVADIDVRADRLDPGIQSLLHDAGAHTIAQLHRKVLEEDGYESPRIEVRYLSPGASGAAVCVVTSKAVGVGPMAHVLKMSMAERTLQREVEGGVLARSVLSPRWLVQHHPEGLIGPINGWYALGATLAEGAVTLRTWLAGGPRPETVEDVFETLFLEALEPMYSANGRQVEGNALEKLSFPHHRQRRVLHAMNELHDALARQDGGDLADRLPVILHDLTDFIVDGRLPRTSPRELPRRTHSTYAHGDLHGGNVLVYGGRHPSPTLIDPSDFGQAHWASDPATLAVDLVMRCIDCERAESMFFTGFAIWRTLVERIGDLRADLAAVSTAPANTATLAALSWLTTNLRRVCAPLATDDDDRGTRWEWNIALAAQLLRTTYHTDLPPPKRALAVVAAHDQLKAAERLLSADDGHRGSLSA